MDYDKKDLYVAIPWPDFESLKDEVSDSDAYFYLTDDKADGYESLIQAYASFYNQTFKDK